MASQTRGISGALQGTMQGAFNKGQSMLDTRFPPERRRDAWAWMNRFANERPKLAAFVFAQIAISGVPLGLFILTALTVAVFSLSTALLVGLLGALLFTVFTVGVALVVLLPTLFFTTMAATFLFLWGLAAYTVVMWFNERRVPGVHRSFVEGTKGEVLAVANEEKAAHVPSGTNAQTGAEPKAAEHASGNETKRTSSYAANGAPPIYESRTFENQAMVPAPILQGVAAY